MVLGPGMDFDETQPKRSPMMRKYSAKNFGPPAQLFWGGGAKMCFSKFIF